MKKKVTYQVGSDNVFADIGVPDAEEALAKADLARRVIAAIRAKGSTQEKAASVLGISQPKISDLMRGRLSGFSMERLMRFLIRLGKDVQVVVKEPIRARSDVRVFGGSASGSGPLIVGSSHVARVFNLPANSRASAFRADSLAHSASLAAFMKD